jgi:putative transposase
MKPGVFTQLYVHLIFAVKYRDSTLSKEIRPKIFRYMSGIISQKGHKSIIVNGVSDHVHILVGLNPNEKISDLVGNIKRGASTLINENRLLPTKFLWQDGYGAFSYSKSQLSILYKYIANQEAHHRRKTFREEYIDVLNKFEIEYNEKYLFDFFISENRAHLQP